MAYSTDSIRGRAWYSEVAPDAYLGHAPTMLSDGEQRMLHWLAREYPIDGSIVDGGSFLGGSTLALATGLAARDTQPHPSAKIHAYDMFVAPNDDVSLGYMPGKSPGDSVLDNFAALTRAYEGYITVHAGDVLQQTAPDNIDILFIDICKTNEINRHVLANFFPALHVDSILIQQDFNEHSCPWVNASMAALADHFETLIDQGGSRVYRTVRVPSAEELRSAGTLTAKEQFALMFDSASTMNDVSRYFTLVSAAWPLFDVEGLAAAKRHLDNVEVAYPQPWDGPLLTSRVKNILDTVREPEALQQRVDTYFSAGR